MTSSSWLRSILDFARRGRPTSEPDHAVVLESSGYCPICGKAASFRSENSWLRDHFVCLTCWSIPRERALMAVIDARYPNWRELVVHESSPAIRGASSRLREGCVRYTPTQFYPDVSLGSTERDYRCENLESLTFPDESIDLHVSQDVLEHVFDPTAAFREIARTLKPGGAHIFTVPLVYRSGPSRCRARRRPDGTVEHLEPPEFHGNPIDDQGSLVVTDWGFDIVKAIHDSSGLFTYVFHIDDLSRGIRAEYIEVLMTVKPSDGIDSASVE